MDMTTEENAQLQGAAVIPPVTQEAGNSAPALFQPSPGSQDLSVEGELRDYNDPTPPASPTNKGKEEAETADVFAEPSSTERARLFVDSMWYIVLSTTPRTRPT